MKYIEEKYQQLLSQQRHSYEHIISNLEVHIDWLENELKKYEKDPLEAEIAKLNEQPQVILNDCPLHETAESQSSELQKQIEELKKENRGLKISNGHLKSTKVKKVKTYKKNVVCLCKDCKKYFQACRKDAQRCADCKRKHAAELTKSYRAKQEM